MQRDEFDDEIAAHLEHETARWMEEGLPEAEARTMARRKFGNVTRVKETRFESHRFAAVERVRQDLSYALRGLRQQPGFAIAAVVALGLGIGANTAVFSVVNAVALRPLPYPHQEELVWMTQVLKKNSTDEVTITPDYLDWRASQKSFVHLAAYNPGQRILSGADGATPVQSPKTSHNLLPALGVTPLLGRVFHREEDIRGNDRVAILSYGLWQRAFGGATSVIGQNIVLDGETHQVVGVLPADFVFPGAEPADLITPLGKREADELKRGDSVSIVRNVIGRLKPGVTRQTAVAELMVLQKSLPEMPWKPEISIKAMPLEERLMQEARKAGWLLFAATGVLLLIACANVANLLLAQGARRAPEMALRASLGATRGRLVAQLLVEATVLAVLAAVVGLALGYSTRGLLLTIVPARYAGLDILPLDGRVIGFSLLIATLTTMVFALGPALRLSRVDYGTALKQGGITKAADPMTRRFLSVLAATQIAMTLVLLTAAGYLLDQFLTVRYRDLGYGTDHRVVATVLLDWKRYPTEAAKVEMQRQLAAALETIPGAEGVGLTEAGLLPSPEPPHPTNTYGIEGRPQPLDGPRPVAMMQAVSSDYLRVLGMRLRAGRWFVESDGKAAIVSEGVAKQSLEGENPLGRRLNSGWTIVGIVEGKVPTIYYLNQPMGQIGILVRTGLDAGIAAGYVRAAVARVDRNQPVMRIQMLDERLDDAVRRPRSVMASLAAFALVALTLAWVGVYGVMNSALRWRMREMAIRLALGAPAGSIRRLLLGQVLWLLVPGIGVGLLLCLVRTEARLPWFAGSAAAVLAVSALVAAWAPARRAARVDAASLLRSD